MPPIREVKDAEAFIRDWIEAYQEGRSSASSWRSFTAVGARYCATLSKTRNNRDAQ